MNRPQCDYNFKWLLHPMPVERFFDEYWEKKPLILKNRGKHYYQSLFTLEDVDHVLQRAKFSKEDLFVAKSTKKVPQDSFLSKSSHVNLSKLFELFAKGNTIYFYQLHLLHDKVRNLCRNLENEFCLESHPAVFLTPAGTQGTPPHYDVPNIFVLQLEGKKEWQLYPPQGPKPYRKEDIVQIDPASLGEAEITVQLEAGDLLYFPRAYIHAPRALDDYSLHLTIGLIPRLWFEVLKAGLEQMIEKEHLRAALPLHAIKKGPDRDTEARWRKVLKKFAEDSDLEKILQQFREEFYSNRPFSPDGHFRQLVQIDQVTYQTMVVPRTHLHASVQWEDDFKVAIVFSGGKLTAPPHVHPTFEDIAGRREPFCAADLAGDIGPEDKVSLIRRLIRAGMLRVMREPPLRESGNSP